MPMTASTPSVGMDQKQFISEISNIQKSLFEQAATYTKVIIGLGYVGFFGAWAGTKANLRPWELVSSAFLICLSLLAYISFEIVQVRFTSKAAIDLARTINRPGLELSALVQYKQRTVSAQEKFFKVWSVVFYFCVATGILGALILLIAFLHSLWRMI